MRISTKGRYALRVMLDLAVSAKDNYVSLKEVADRQDISMKYLEMIVGILNRAGYVSSLRGKNGGYRLSKMPEEYTVGSVLRLTEGDLAPVSCLECNAEHCAREDDCMTLPMWKKLDRVINDYLDSVTLQDMLEQDNAAKDSAR